MNISSVLHPNVVAFAPPCLLSTAGSTRYFSSSLSVSVSVCPSRVHFKTPAFRSLQASAAEEASSAPSSRKSDKKKNGSQLDSQLSPQDEADRSTAPLSIADAFETEEDISPSQDKPIEKEPAGDSTTSLKSEITTTPNTVKLIDDTQTAEHQDVPVEAKQISESELEPKQKLGSEPTSAAAPVPEQQGLNAKNGEFETQTDSEVQKQSDNEIKSETPPDPEIQTKSDSEIKSDATASEAKLKPESLEADGKSDSDSPSETQPKPDDKSEKIELSSEEMEKSKAARAAAEEAASAKQANVAERNKKIRQNVDKVLTTAGTKTRTFELGTEARARAEAFVARTISEGDEEKATQPTKLKGKAAKAAQTAVQGVTVAWQEKAVPKISEQLPEELRDVKANTLASFALGLFVAVVLAPSFLFSGGGGKPEAKKIAQIDKDTSTLEKKLSKKVDSDMSTAKKSGTPAEKMVFPPAEESPSATTSRPSITAKKSPSSSSSYTGSASRTTPTAPSGSSPSSTTTTPPPSTATITTPPMTEKKLEPVAPKETIALKDVTPSMVLSTVTKKLSGSNTQLVLSAEFDSLYAEPTVALTVSKAYHKLGSNEQRAIAESALQAVRTLGYERVTLNEEGTGRQVAQAGIGVDLEDETENLRAEMKAMRNTADKLAIRALKDETAISGLTERLEEERELLAKQKVEYDRNVASLRGEVASLADDLVDAKDELARMPDRLDLERRTIEAEETATKFSNSVEMLSAQLTKARNEESAAKEEVKKANAQVEAAAVQRDSAIAQAKEEEKAAISKAQKEAAGNVEAMKKEAAESISASEERAKQADAKLQSGLKAAETRIAEIQANADKKIAEEVQVKEKTVGTVSKKFEGMLEDAKKTAAAEVDAQKAEKNILAKQVEEVQAAKEKEVASVSKKYDAELEEMRKKYTAELEAEKKNGDSKVAQSMKDAKAEKAAVEKQRDAILKEKAALEDANKKAAEKAAKDIGVLEKQISKLQAKAKDEAAAAAAAAAAAQQEAQAVPQVASPSPK